MWEQMWVEHVRAVPGLVAELGVGWVAVREDDAREAPAPFRNSYPYPFRNSYPYPYPYPYSHLYSHLYSHPEP
jgi:hypothetical protein